jgi:hypothetical protein
MTCLNNCKCYVFELKVALFQQQEATLDSTSAAAVFESSDDNNEASDNTETFSEHEFLITSVLEVLELPECEAGSISYSP